MLDSVQLWSQSCRFRFLNFSLSSWEQQRERITKTFSSSTNQFSSNISTKTAKTIVILKVHPEEQSKNQRTLDPSHPNISIHILHTLIYKSPCYEQGEFVQQSKFLRLMIVSLILMIFKSDSALVL